MFGQRCDMIAAGSSDLGSDAEDDDEIISSQTHTHSSESHVGKG